MRFSIFEYSQEKLVSLGLDVSDALLLNWFANFFAGKMEKRTFKDANGNNKIFGWVKISKVQEDLPVLGISTERGIRRKFDNFVEKGILERETIISQAGKKSYYKPTDLYETLINTDAIQKEDSSKSSQRNSSSFAKETTIQNEEEIPQRTKMTYAKNEDKNQTSKSSQRNSSSYAERNSKTYAQGNSSSYALNNSLNKDYVIKDTAAMLSLSERFFGKNAFDSGFAEKAAAFLSLQNIKEYACYFEFIKNKVTEKSKTQNTVNNPRGLAYKLFFQVDVVQEYKDKEQQLILQKQKEKEKLMAEEKRKLTCPVCGEHFLPDYKENCPSCNFEILKFSSQKDIAVHKRFISLPESKRKEYESKLNEIYQIDFFDFIKLNPAQKAEKQKQREIKLHKLYAEFGLIG